MTTSRSITRFRLLLRRQLPALVLGMGAAVAVSLPPLRLAERIDAHLFDWLTALGEPSAPDDVVVVTLTDPAWLGVLTELAEKAGSRLVVTTFAQPPSERVNATALGPTELPIGAQLIRRTDWRSGGHLQFAADADGRVRRLPPGLDGDPALPSLALTAYRKLGGAAAPRTGRLQLIDPKRYSELSADDLRADPQRIAGAVVVAGRPEPLLATPVGALAPPELVAQAIEGYRAGTLIGDSSAAVALPWGLAIATLATLFVMGNRRRAVALAAGAAAIPLTTTATFLLGGLWAPPTAALALLATGGGLLLGRRERRPARPGQPVEAEAILVALASGNVESAWPDIVELPAERANLDALCDIGEALLAERYRDLAADVFLRAATIDPRHRNVARRLIEATQTEAEREAAETAAADLEIPDVLGRYEILEPIGRGSTGTVYLAVDQTISRLIALKVINLKAEYDADSLDEGLERFHREAASAGRLKHPSIVTIYDIGEANGLAYIAMEYLKGRHLAHFATPETLLPPALVLDICADIADALDYAHSRNVVHRDIKPSNIMYDSVAGSATITDFGIARLIDVSRTRTGVVLGTPSFMAPEQLEGKNVNRHTDLFALGVTIYELLTGRLPFLGASMTKLMFVIANEPHAPVTALRPELPASLDSVLDRALAKCPGDRFDRGADMASALRLAASELA